jgi:hypothetical protein
MLFPKMTSNMMPAPEPVIAGLGLILNQTPASLLMRTAAGHREKQPHIHTLAVMKLTRYLLLLPLLAFATDTWKPFVVDNRVTVQLPAQPTQIDLAKLMG